MTSAEITVLENSVAFVFFFSLSRARAWAFSSVLRFNSRWQPLERSRAVSFVLSTPEESRAISGPPFSLFYCSALSLSFVYLIRSG